MRRRHDPPGRLIQSIPVPFDYELRKPDGNPARLFLLLHGHAESGKKIFDKLAPSLPASAAVLSPNGPFPIADYGSGDWKTRQNKLTYSWHFYDPASAAYLISPDTAIAHLEQGMKTLGLWEIPKTVIGFSQGGYLAHHLAPRLPRLEQVIAIGCEFLADEFAGSGRARLDGIFGEKDHIVKADRVRETHRTALANASGGTLIAIPDLGHEIDERVAAKVAELIAT